jgi:hypothetical protein
MIDDLIETLEKIVGDADWALAADRPKETLKDRIAGLRSLARQAIDEALSLSVENPS